MVLTWLTAWRTASSAVRNRPAASSASTHWAASGVSSIFIAPAPFVNHSLIEDLSQIDAQHYSASPHRLRMLHHLNPQACYVAQSRICSPLTHVPPRPRLHLPELRRRVWPLAGQVRFLRRVEHHRGGGGQNADVGRPREALSQGPAARPPSACRRRRRCPAHAVRPCRA